MSDIKDGGWVLDASAHLLSRALVSQSASITFCRLSRAVVLNVSIVFMIYCVNVVFTWSILLVFSIRYTWCIKTWKVNVAGARFYKERPEGWCIKYSVTWSVKHTPACQSTMLPKCKKACDMSIGSMQRIISQVNVAICISPSLRETRLRSCRSLCTASQPRRPESTYSPPWESEI
jgi:hypothetical protein